MAYQVKNGNLKIPFKVVSAFQITTMLNDTHLRVPVFACKDSLLCESLVNTHTLSLVGEDVLTPWNLSPPPPVH